MTLQRRGLATIAVGLGLMAAGVLGEHFAGGHSITVATVQPSHAYLRSLGAHSTRLFPSYRPLAIYTYRAPDWRAVRGVVSGGLLSQVLVVLGNRRGAAVAVTEWIGPPGGPGLIATGETGWTTALPPAPKLEPPMALGSAPAALRQDIGTWLTDKGLRGSQVTLWTFGAQLLAVAQSHGQSSAASFPVKGGRPHPVMGAPDSGRVEGLSTATFKVRRKP